MQLNKPVTKTDPVDAFKREVAESIASYKDDKIFQKLSADWMIYAFKHKYMYNFTTLGRPHIQLPGDIMVTQEIIWEVKPDVIVETGIAHGGSIIHSASMLALIDYCEAVEQGAMLDPSKPKRKVIAVDIDIREHNRNAIEAHPLANRIDMIQGSSIDPAIVAQVKQKVQGAKKVMVLLDSMHTHDHVLAELNAYAPLTTVGSYCVVYDTIIEDLPDDMFPDRPWSVGNNSKTAMREYLKTHPEFVSDTVLDAKLLITVAPDGFLKRVR